MPVTQRDLAIPAGGTVEFVVDVVGGPASLAGYTGSMMIRALRDDAGVLAEVPGSGISINAGTRQVSVQIPSSETAEYTWRRGVWDLRITGPSSDSWILVGGRITNLRAVTRED